MLRMFVLSLMVLLVGCGSIEPKAVTESDRESYARFVLPVPKQNIEEVPVLVVHLYNGGSLEAKPPAKYRWVKYVQIDQSEQRSVAPGENIEFNIKPGTHKIKITGTCPDSSSPPPPSGSTITPDSTSWKKQTRTFEVTVEPGKTNIIPFSLGCVIHRHDGNLYLLGGIVERDINNKYIVFKTKSVSN